MPVADFLGRLVDAVRSAVCVHPVRDYLIGNYFVALIYGTWLLLPWPTFCSQVPQSGRIEWECYAALPINAMAKFEIGFGVILIVTGVIGLCAVLYDWVRVLEACQVVLVFWWILLLYSFVRLNPLRPATPIYSTAVFANCWLLWRCIVREIWIRQPPNGSFPL